MNSLVKSTIGLMIATIFSKVLGFGRELALASTYGAGMQSDAYLMALNIPNVLFASIGGALSTTFIPLYWEAYNKDGKDKAMKLTNNILNIVISICIIISILGIIFSEQIVRVFAVGFSGEKLYLTVEFTKIFMISIIFIGITTILTSYLQIKGNFIIPGLVGIPYNIIIIASILGSLNNIYILVYGTLFAIFSQIIVLLPFAIKNKYRYKPILNINDEYIKKMIWLVIPIFIGVATNQLNVAVDKALASTLVDGSISALNYADKLNLFIMALFITSITSVLYPTLSKLCAEKNNTKLAKVISDSIDIVILFIVPITMGSIVLAEPIVKLLFERGQFDVTATKMTSIALVFYSIGMIGVGLRTILGKVFYSLQDTKTPMINGAIAMIFNIILNFILVKLMGHAGLAFATSISAIIGTLLLFRSLKKHIIYFGQDKIIKTTIKSLFAAIIMAIITKVVYGLLNGLLGNGFIYESITLFLSIGVGATIYTIGILILKVEEVNFLLEIIKKRLCK